MSCFQCSKCGQCCSNYLPLTEKEIKQLRGIVKTRKLKPTKRLFETNNYSTCPFLDSNNRCIIYEERPNICKQFTCDRFKRRDYEGVEINERVYFTDLRKDIFYE